MKKVYLLLLFALTSHLVFADNIVPKDTTKVVDIEEIVVISSPKETTKLRQLPASVSLLSQKDLQAYQITSLKNISGVVPNFFVPDYGSRLTSAVYIRGIGARINTPAVGLYVDNVPYIDKSAFDFNYFDIERIDILRGPQGTLYGRNTMGGLIKIHTRSPFTYQGTDLKLSAGTYNNYSASVTHYHRLNEKFAFSAGGFYEYGGGYFDNTYLNKKADALSAGGGRMRAIWLPTNDLKLDFSLGYEYNDQGGYAYGAYDKATGKVAQVAFNDESSYRRGLLNSSLNIEYQGKGYTLSAVTGFQNMDDRMLMDQDFTPRDVYTIAQNQHQNTVTEEIIFKSNTRNDWQWVTGAFGFWQGLNTNAPVTFKKEGIQMIQATMDEAMAGSPMKIKLTDSEMLIAGNYDTPTFGAALYHQSTYNNLLTEGLSATVGLRLDYEKIKISHHTQTEMNYKMVRVIPGSEIPMGEGSVPINIEGKTSNDYLQLLPKFALKYDFNRDASLYASVSRGYRSGGYNIQMFSDIVQGKMKPAGKPSEETDHSKAVNDAIIYKPEYSWNYEIGTHLSLLNNKLQADFALFYMDTKDQQIAQFAESGLGRMTKNAGHSRSMGVEAALRANIVQAFNLHASYGYTHATFIDYLAREKEGNQIVEISYKGNFVPLSPRNTICVGADYTFTFAKTAFVHSLVIDAQYNGAGKIFWTEKNNIAQNFYGTLNGRLTANAKDLSFSLWTKNALNQEYSTFYFETIGTTMKDKAGFLQKGKPVQLGVDVRYRF